MTTPRVHPTAIVETGAQLASDVSLGAYALVGARVRLGQSCSLHAHAVVTGDVTAGARNVFHSYSVTGGAPQDRRHAAADPAPLAMGDDNEVREHATLHGGSHGGTRIGSRNLFMAGAHVGHDVVVGDDVTLANAVQIAGHVSLEDHVVIGGLAGVAQHVRVGEGAFVAGGAMVERAVPPFVIVQGDRARVRALNVVGLRRRGVSEASINELRRVFRVIYGGGRLRAAALAALERDPPIDPLAMALVAAVRATARAA